MNLLRPRFSHTSAVDCKRMSTHFFSLLAVITLGLVMPTGQAQPSPPVGNLPGKIPDEQLFGFIGKDPLPAGTVPWQLLRQVKLVEVKGKSAKAGAPQVLPEFGPRIQELDKKEVKLYGFVMPLSTSARQKHFLLSPLPSHCPYCVYQGPDSLVEVVAKVPVEYNQWEPIIVTGRFELVNDTQLFYRLTNAEAVKQ
jgi:hypothetical protein